MSLCLPVRCVDNSPLKCFLNCDNLLILFYTEYDIILYNVSLEYDIHLLLVHSESIIAPVFKPKSVIRKWPTSL